MKKLYSWKVNCEITLTDGTRKQETVEVQAITEMVAKAGAVLKYTTAHYFDEPNARVLAKDVERVGFVKEFV